MTATSTQIVTPYHLDNFKGKISVINELTGELVKSDFKKPSDAKMFCDMLNHAYREGFIAGMKRK